MWGQNQVLGGQLDWWRRSTVDKISQTIPYLLSAKPNYSTDGKSQGYRVGINESSSGGDHFLIMR